MRMAPNQIYDFLQSLMPPLQWVNPYLSDDAIPPVDTDWATFNIMRVDDRGWSQPRQTSYDANTGIITLAYDVQRIYSLQLDFYGPNAFENASVFKQTLQVALARQHGIGDLKALSGIRNLTFLQEDKEYMPRYNFDVDIFVVDTITQTAPVIEKAIITKIYRAGAKS